MRPRRASPDQVSETARRRLELLTAELALMREEPDSPPHDAAPLGEEPEAPHHEPGQLFGPHAGPGWAEGNERIVEAASPPPGSVSAPPPGRHARRPVGGAARLAGWLHDRLPATLQGRVGLSSGNLTVVALLVAAGFAVTAWWVVRADSPGEVVPPSTWVEGLEATAGADADPAAEPAAVLGETPGAAQVGVEAGVGEATGVVVVDVTGKVRRRGIVTLPLGSRVVDAIEAAGGPRRGVDLAPLNLARVLVDGEQIVVGVPPPAGVAAAAASAASASGGGDSPLVNINVASQTELEELPGVGPVTAEAIISWRTENGAFTSVDELLEVSGIGDATLADIAPHVTL